MLRYLEALSTQPPWAACTRATVISWLSSGGDTAKQGAVYLRPVFTAHPRPSHGTPHIGPRPRTAQGRQGPPARHRANTGGFQGTLEVSMSARTPTAGGEVSWIQRQEDHTPWLFHHSSPPRSEGPGHATLYREPAGHLKAVTLHGSRCPGGWFHMGCIRALDLLGAEPGAGPRPGPALGRASFGRGSGGRGAARERASVCSGLPPAWMADLGGAIALRNSAVIRNSTGQRLSQRVSFPFLCFPHISFLVFLDILPALMISSPALGLPVYTHSTRDTGHSRRLGHWLGCGGELSAARGRGSARQAIGEVLSAFAAFLRYLKAINSNGPDDKPFLSGVLVRAPPHHAKGPGTAVQYATCLFREVVWSRTLCLCEPSLSADTAINGRLLSGSHGNLRE
ncbi:unnamed protein product [Gadus morhua 'NCC']